MIPRHLFCFVVALLGRNSCSNVGTLHAMFDRDLAKAAQKGADWQSDTVTLRRPSCLPRALALASPSRTRSWIIARWSMTSISIETSPCRSASIEALLMEEQIDAERLQLRQEANEVLQAPSQALLEGDPPRHQPTLEIGGLGHGACFFGNNGRPPRFNCYAT